MYKDPAYEKKTKKKVNISINYIILNPINIGKN